MSRAVLLACLLALPAGTVRAQSAPAPADGAAAAKSAPLPKAKLKEFAEALGWWLLMAEDPNLAASKKREEKLEKLKKLESYSWKGARAAFNGWSPHPRGMPKQDMTHKLEYKFNAAVFTQNRTCFGVPSRYQPGHPTPIVLALHGGGRGVGDGSQAYGGYGASLVSKGCFCIAPTVPGNYIFAEPTSERFIKYLLHEVIRDYSVDLDRIYCVGHSLGGVGAWSMGVRFPDYFAGTVAGAGNEPGCLDFEVLYNTPMFIHHGETDIQVKPDQDKAAESKIRQIQPPLRNIVFRWYVAGDGRGHSYPDEVRKEYEAWLLPQKRDMYPKRVVCTCPISRNQDEKWGVIFDGKETSQSVFWLGIENRTAGDAKAIAEVTKGNTIEVKATNCPRIAVYVSDEFLDLDQPVVVNVNGKKLHDANVPRSAEFLARHIEETDDRGRFFANKITLDVR